MKIVIDDSCCIAAGNCVLESPEVFDQRDEDGVVVILDDDPQSEALRATVRQAAALCPANVITVVE